MFSKLLDSFMCLIGIYVWTQYMSKLAIQNDNYETMRTVVCGRCGKLAEVSGYMVKKRIKIG